MKKISVILAFVLLLSFALTACGDQMGKKSSDPVITLSENSCTLNPGGTCQLSYTVNPEGTPVEFITSNPQVVSVDNTGKLTALDIGTASVAVSAGEYSRAYMDVTVALPAATSIPCIQVSSNSLEMITGSDFTLSAQVEDGKNTLEGISLLWTVADTAVATVDGGKVTAIAPGETELTVSGEVNGQKVEKEVSIKVFDYYEISLDQDVIDAPIGQTIRIQATIKDASGQVVIPQKGELEYISSDPKAIAVNGDTFRVISISDRIPSVGVRYKGNVASVPVNIFSVTADFFSNDTVDFYGEVDGVTFSGVLYKSTAYQPIFYLTQDGINRLNSYAAEHGYTKLRIHSYSILLNNAFVLDNRIWTETKSWDVSDVHIKDLSTEFQFWSQSEGTTEIYMWFELI